MGRVGGAKSRRELTPEQAHEMGSKGGTKSRRVLTPEQAQEMARKSAETRRRNKAEREQRGKLEE